MTADESRELPHRSYRNQAESSLGQMWPLADGEPVTARHFAYAARAVVWALFDVADAMRELRGALVLEGPEPDDG